jgi:hypothetical protein
MTWGLCGNNALITWPTAGTLIVAGGNSPTGLAEVNNNCILGNGSNWTVSTNCALLTTTQSFTGAKTFGNNDLLILGSSTGTTTLASANNTATAYTATLPINTGTLAEINLAQTWTAQQTHSANIDITSDAILTEIANASTTGTTVNHLASLTGAPSTAVLTTAGATSGAAGIVVAGAGTTGNAQIARSGQASCTFDNTTTAGDYVQISTGTNGDCHDTGASTYPTSGQVLGRVLASGAAGLQVMTVDTGTVAAAGSTNGLTGAGAGTSGYAQPQTLAVTATVTPSNPVGQETYYGPATLTNNITTLNVPTTISPDQNFTFEYDEPSSGSTYTIVPAAGYVFLTGTPSFETVAPANGTKIVFGCYATTASTTGTGTANCAYYNPGVSTSSSNTWSGSNSFGQVYGSSRVMTTGTTDTLLATDCGKQVIYDLGAYNVTVPSGIVPTSGTTCRIDIITATANKVTLTGSGVTVQSADGYTGTQAHAWSGISLTLTTVASTPEAIIFGHGS